MNYKQQGNNSIVVILVISGGELPNVLAKVAESTGKMGSILIRLRSNNAGGKNTNSRHKICLEWRGSLRG